MPQTLSQDSLNSARMRLEFWQMLVEGIRAYSEGFYQCAAGLTRELLQSLPARPPDSKKLDYWATLSSCLTDLDIAMDPQEPQLLQPAYLNELTRLTRLAFREEDHTSSDAQEELWSRYAFELPELKNLCLSNLLVDTLKLQCPQLKILRIEGCAMDKLYLQASLQHVHLEDSTLHLVHEGFPIANLIGLTYLSLNNEQDIDVEALPLMTWLHTLNFYIWDGSLPVSLPNSLRDLTLVFSSDEAWDSLVIPLVQQLRGVESICIEIYSQDSALIGDKSLDHDLRPFLAMTTLRHLQFWNLQWWRVSGPQVWKASALRQLGELEAEVIRSGNKLQLRY